MVSSISCSAYDVLESSAIRKVPLQLNLEDGSSLTGTIIDLVTRGKEEFCRFRPAHAIALDSAGVKELESGDLEIPLLQIAQIVDTASKTVTATNHC